jgi:hypothetical protein
MSDTAIIYSSANVKLPDTFKNDTWDGITWAISSVDSNDSRFASALSSVRFQLQTVSGTSALTLTSATAGEITINTATSNAWSVTIEPRILAIADGEYLYGLEFTDADGVVKTYLTGSLTVLADPVI